ncbi:DUF998 domain-containing protein [Nakamurella lactea]|uniref:DUF998 domain-containing protein n=1 Tax=Nakamurella lactea TaxID=459515 RepID=UPI00041C15A5|nr:DUF998 domain-containing protein [Nakamurella lactea]
MRISPFVAYRVGTGVIAVGWLLFILMQWVSGDWLPPAISFSQYGVGPHGWLFSLYLLAFSIGPLLLDRANPTGRLTTTLLVIGFLGCLVMALVATDPGGLQQSPRAKVHMVGSVFGLSLVPIGCCLSLVRGRRVSRWLPLGLIGVSAVSLILLIVSATGVDTLGVGAAESWTYSQTGAAVVDMLMLVALVAGSRPLPGESDHTDGSGRPDRARSGVTAPPQKS